MTDSNGLIILSMANEKTMRKMETSEDFSVSENGVYSIYFKFNGKNMRGNMYQRLRIVRNNSTKWARKMNLSSALYNLMWQTVR